VSAVAYQGAPGAFGEAACRRFLPDWTPVPLPSFAAVAMAVAERRVARGMLPIENRIAGVVPGVSDLIAGHAVAVVARHSLPIEIHLLAAPGTTLASVRRVASHPVALAQCAGWLERHGLAAEPAANTAIAARALAESRDPALGVAASASAAATYGLEILVRDIHDRAGNATLFAEIAPA
jgi:prephenate dehydratase